VPNGSKPDGQELISLGRRFESRRRHQKIRLAEAKNQGIIEGKRLESPLLYGQAGSSLGRVDHRNDLERHEVAPCGDLLLEQAQVLGLYQLEAAVERELVDPAVHILKTRGQRAFLVAGSCIDRPRTAKEGLDHYEAHRSSPPGGTEMLAVRYS